MWRSLRSWDDVEVVYQWVTDRHSMSFLHWHHLTRGKVWSVRNDAHAHRDDEVLTVAEAWDFPARRSTTQH